MVIIPAGKTLINGGSLKKGIFMGLRIEDGDGFLMTPTLVLSSDGTRRKDQLEFKLPSVGRTIFKGCKMDLWRDIWELRPDDVRFVNDSLAHHRDVMLNYAEIAFVRLLKRMVMFIRKNSIVIQVRYQDSLDTVEESLESRIGDYIDIKI